jgi:hypothetical protein
MGFEPLIDLHEVKALSGNAWHHEVAAFKVVGYTAHHPNEAKLKVQEWVRNLEAAPRVKVTSRPSYIACVKPCIGRGSNGSH